MLDDEIPENSPKGYVWCVGLSSAGQFSIIDGQGADRLLFRFCGGLAAASGSAIPSAGLIEPRGSTL